MVVRKPSTRVLQNVFVLFVKIKIENIQQLKIENIKMQIENKNFVEPSCNLEKDLQIANDSKLIFNILNILFNIQLINN